MIFVVSLLLLAAAAVNSQRQDYRPARPEYYEAPRPYSFSFNNVLDDGIGQISRQETQDASGRVQGSYSLSNDEGHTRIVDYVADQDGFRAHVRTNEPGTDNQNPADVIFESNSPYANRNVQYSRGGNPGGIYRRPVVSAAGPEPFAPEIAPVDAVPDNVIPPARGQVYRRPSPVNRNYRPAARNPFLRV